MAYQTISLALVTTRAIRRIISSDPIADRLQRARLDILDMGCANGTATKGMVRAFEGISPNINVLGIDSGGVGNSASDKTVNFRWSIDLRGNTPLTQEPQALALREQVPSGFDVITIMNPCPPTDITGLFAGFANAPTPQKRVELIRRITEYGVTVDPELEDNEFLHAITPAFFDQMIRLTPLLLSKDGIIIVTCEVNMLAPSAVRKNLLENYRIQLDVPNPEQAQSGAEHSHLFAATRN